MLIVMIIFSIIIISLLLVLGFETPAAHSGLWHPVVPVGAGDFLPLVFLQIISIPLSNSSPVRHIRPFYSTCFPFALSSCFNMPFL